MFFIVLFATEQTLLIGLTTYYKDEANLLRLIISIFALVVMTTASLQKFVLETKRRYENETRESIEENTKTTAELKSIVGAYQSEVSELKSRILQKKE